MIAGTFFEVLRHYREWKNESTDIEHKGNRAQEAIAAGLFGQFMTICTCFGIAQGCILATVTYTTTFMNNSIGSYCVGIFFGTFTLFSFCAADSVVTVIGALKTFQFSFGFLLGDEILLWISCHVHQNTPADTVHIPSAVLAYIGSLLAGIGFSLMCTSEAVYYQQVAKKYSEVRGLSSEQVNDTFGGVFTMIYVPLEMLLKQAASLLIYIALRTSNTDDDDDDDNSASSGSVISNGSSWDDTVVVDDGGSDGRRMLTATIVGVKVWMDVFTMYVIFLACSFFAATRIKPVPDADEEVDENASLNSTIWRRIRERTLETPRMIVENNVLFYLMPINITFGVCGGFLYTYFYSETVSKYLGDSVVGFASAIGSGFCAVSVLPLNVVTMLVGKGPVILYASVCFASIAVLYLTVSPRHLGSWGGIFAIGALMGCGRAVWENTNKAIYADLFPTTEISSAYANMYMSTGCTTFLCLFVFPSLPVNTMCAFILMPALLMWPGYKNAVKASRLTGRYQYQTVPVSDEKGVSPNTSLLTSSSSSNSSSSVIRNAMFEDEDEDGAYGSVISL